MICSSAARVGALLAAMLLAVPGCDAGPKVHPVKGRVVNKGTGQVKDLAGYGVQFQSVSDPTEMPGGTIEEDGTFVLQTRVGGEVVPGVKEGTYRACLVPPAVEGGPPPKLIVPRRYMSLETAKLEYTIKPGENDIAIEVERDR